MNYYASKMRAPRFYCFSPQRAIGTYCNWKNQNPGSRFGATSLPALPIWPIWSNFEVNWLDWQCCLAGSSKMAPRILIFSIAMGADYSFYVKSTATYAPAFLRYNNSVLARVVYYIYNDFGSGFKNSYKDLPWNFLLLTWQTEFTIYSNLFNLKFKVSVLS